MLCSLCVTLAVQKLKGSSSFDYILTGLWASSAAK